MDLLSVSPISPLLLYNAIYIFILMEIRYAYNPSQAPGFTESFDLLDNSAWGTVEWYYEGGNQGTQEQQWEQAFDSSFRYVKKMKERKRKIVKLQRKKNKKRDL